MYTKIKVYSKKKYLVLYFKKDGHIVRYNTLIKIKNKREELTSDGYFRSTVQDADKLNENLRETKSLVDLAISNLLTANPNIILSNQKVKEEIERIRYARQVKNVDGYYKDFLEYKFNQIQLKKQSRKDYISLQNALIDYQLMYNRKLTVEDLNYVFTNKFIRFLEKPHKSDKTKEYKTKGNLGKNTIIKRLDNYKEFLHFLDDEHIREFDKKIKKISFSNYDTDIVTLEPSEIDFLHKYREENEQKYTKKQTEIFDAFLFNLHVGLRFSDLASLNQSNFEMVKYNNEQRIKLTKILNKNSTRNRSQAIVPLNFQADEIIRKYNFTFNLGTNQVFNQVIKKILKDTEKFEEKIKVHKENTQKTYSEEYIKRKLIGCHTCRRTFITNHIKRGTPLSDLMRMTGHKKLETLKKYIDKFSSNEFQHVD